METCERPGTNGQGHRLWQPMPSTCSRVIDRLTQEGRRPASVCTGQLWLCPQRLMIVESHSVLRKEAPAAQHV